MNKRAEYVYVISNLSLFGKNIYKIGINRHFVSMQRVDELALKTALHNVFEYKKV